MKKILLKFADSTLQKDELKSIKGGYGSCGQCWNYGSGKPMSCFNDTSGACTCGGGGSANFCG